MSIKGSLEGGGHCVDAKRVLLVQAVQGPCLCGAEFLA